MAVGKTPEGRSVAGVGTTNTSAAITAPAGSFHNPEDVGRTISGAGIPAGRTIASVQSGTAATMSGAANATGSTTAILGEANPANYGFVGWSPETDAESGTYRIAAGAGANAPDRLPNALTPVTQRARG
jgi:hypothetical protein